ncbi:hypothetical protein OSB04_029858 [Centaurea solstitialis]|uniref:Integrase catalytic domain-containing protein n=1 Tax=Centaurea solstitialis TaxID=347529 RepID=A0AA38W398_9ASTR|nr:hypothetical protein OSB04_029858 [Centaurea solstitialis]
MTSSPASSTLSSPTASQLVFALTNVYSQFSFKLSSDGSKYKLWRRIFLDMCKGAKVYGHITGKSKPVSDNDEDWEAIDSRIKSWFYSTCDANLLQIISSDDCTAKDLWDKLDEFFLNNKMSRMLQLQEQFRNTKKGTSSITDFCHNLKNLADALADCDSKIDEIELVMQILRQLPPSYHSIVDVITNTKPFPSFLEAKNMLLLHESREESVEPHTDTPLTSSAALYSSTPSAPNGKPKNKSNKGNQGHSQAYFGASPHAPPAQPGLLGAPPVHSFGTGAPQPSPTMFSAPQHPSPHTFHPSPVPSSPYLYGQHQSPHSVPVPPPYGQPIQPSTPVPLPPQPSFGGHASQFSQPQYTDLSSVFQAMSVQAPQDNNFYMDSGATRHMTFNQGTMHSLTPCNSNFIQVGNGAMVPARYIGHCTLPYSSYPLHLNNVLVSDKLIKNLISVRRFTIDNSVSVEFDPFGFTVKDLKTGSFLQRCDSDHHDLYPVLPPAPRSTLASANVAVSFDVWHRRLGHPGAAIFQFLVSRKFIACSSQSSALCHAYALADCDSKIDEIELVMQILRNQGHSQAYFGVLLISTPQPGLLGAPPVTPLDRGPQPSPTCSVPLSIPHRILFIRRQCRHLRTFTATSSPHTVPVPPPTATLQPSTPAMSVQAPQDNNFYMDSGATRDMTFNQGTMHSLTPCNSNFIQVGNGAMVPARYIGHCTLPYSSYPLHLNNVLVSDKLIKNLISVRRFTIDNSVSVEFDPFGFTVKDLKTGSFLQRCDSDHHDLYPVLPPAPRSTLASANVAVSFDVWHRRLGHPGAAIFQFLVSRKFIACSSQSSALCHACQLGKHCRLPFSLSTTKTSRVFELIHSDLWTSPVISLSGFKYYVLFLDDFSHFLWVFPLRAKSEVFDVFKTFRAYVLNQFKTDIQLFQCDNGREFNNQSFLDFFKTHGIKIRFSCPYTSPQNGKAERTIRTINNTLRTSLIQASLPPKFWVEALLSSVHTFNLLPSTTIQYKTPFEVLFGFSPTYSHLRVFGCLCYPNTAPTAPHKLAPRSSACVYLGPSTDHRGYRCLDLITQKVIISRHVVFDETHFPFPDFQPRPSSEDYDSFDVDDSPPSLSTIPDAVATPPESSTFTSSSSAEPSQPPAPATTSGHPMTTRSRTGSLKPKQIFNLSVTSDISPIPRSAAQAMCDPHWRAAMDAEMAAIISNYTWDLVPKPSDANIVGNRWLFRHKFDSNGRLERYKARLVAQGFSQQPGLDFDDTFSPVVKPATIRTVLSISISRNWPIHQLDVKNAFLHGDLTETVYMRQPPGYVNSSFPDHVCRLRKALYGLKQAPRAWYHRFAVYISSLGFLSSKTDTSLFTYHRGSDTIYLLLYVDDIILTASSPTLISMVISKLSSEFPMSDLGPLSFFLGIAASRSKSGLFLSQSAFAQEILARADMASCNPCSTPADTKTKLAVDGEPVPDPTLYRSLAGALQYLTFTRPDIAYAVQQVCLFMHDPRLPHLNALKRILRYLKGTLSLGLHLKASAVDRLVAYSDADWAGCPNTRRSTSGFCVYLGDNLVSWSSKRQHVVSRSSAEAEYRGIANVVAETAWLRNLLLELCCPLSRATVVFCDNVSAMYLASNPVQHQRTKHVEIDLHFVRERVAIGHVRVLHVPSAYQYADIFTKGLPTSLFLDFRDSLNIRLPPDQTTGVC